MNTKVSLLGLFITVFLSETSSPPSQLTCMLIVMLDKEDEDMLVCLSFHASFYFVFVFYGVFYGVLGPRGPHFVPSFTFDLLILSGLPSETTS